MRTLNKRVAGIFSALILPVLFLSAGLRLTASAADGLPRLVDMADLLSDSEEADLSYMLDEISERQQVDVVVVTVDSMEGESATVYSDDFYDYNGYGFGEDRDGILLLVSMEERDWSITTRGYGITVVTDAGRDYISETIVDDLGLEDYVSAFTNFATLCDDFITQANEGTPYDADNLPDEGGFGIIGSFVIAYGIAFIIALISTGIMKGQLNSVHSQSGADTYMKQDSMQLTKKNDMFLYTRVDRRKKPEKEPQSPSGGSTTHTSSSGATHGGGSGKF